VIFRKDFGKNAHPMGDNPLGLKGDIDHYNIQIQTGKKTNENLHIIPNGKGSFDVYDMKKVIK
jgi:hypothetical protein